MPRYRGRRPPNPYAQQPSSEPAPKRPNGCLIAAGVAAGLFCAVPFGIGVVRGFKREVERSPGARAVQVSPPTVPLAPPPAPSPAPAQIETPRDYLPLAACGPRATIAVREEFARQLGTLLRPRGYRDVHAETAGIASRTLVLVHPQCSPAWVAGWWNHEAWRMRTFAREVCFNDFVCRDTGERFTMLELIASGAEH